MKKRNREKGTDLFEWKRGQAEKGGQIYFQCVENKFVPFCLMLISRIHKFYIGNCNGYLITHLENIMWNASTAY